MPPKGVILFNVSGTGKTFLAKAVANQTSTFLCVAGSELIQKYLGDGLKLVHELFRMAEEHMPVIGTKWCVSFLSFVLDTLMHFIAAILYQIPHLSDLDELTARLNFCYLM